MTTIEERSAYLNNPFNTKPLFGDYSAFYITVAICTVLFTFLVAINIILGCCSRHKYYWQDRHTGNRWLVSIWSATPHKQPPLDFTELQDVSYFQQAPLEQTEYVVSPPRPDEPRGFGRLAHQLHHHQQHQQHHQQHPQAEEYVELQKRESDI
ncbi:hypothetical protein HA402_014912 [Bradysia odoriphaga]|nr:hypothetical protein HA402_014912 [Bradysia odoriphaga]